MNIRLFTRVLLMCTIITTCCLSLWIIPAMASDQEAHKSITALLIMAPETERKKIVDDYINERLTETKSAIEVISISLDQLHNSKRINANAVEWHAAHLLGKTHSNESVSVMVKLVDVRDSNFEPVSNEFKIHWTSFPFAVALAEIGMPAVNPLLDRIKSSNPTTTEFHVSCVTLEAILGKELAKAALRQHADKFAEFKGDGRVEAAIKIVDVGHIDWRATDAKDFRFN